MYLYVFCHQPLPVCVCYKISFLLSFLCCRVIKPEEGKKLADSWGAAFMESSAKENEVMMSL